jgi:hypothetical protein
MHLRSSILVSSFGLFAVRAATLLAPLVIFLALPPFYSGIWVQVEGAMPWLHGISAVAALGCALLASGGDGRAVRALRHPLVLIPALIFALAVLLLPTTTLPALSMFGAPEHGFGALAYLDLAALTAAAFVTLAENLWRRLVLGVTFVAVALAFVLDVLFRAKATWAPFFFSDYLAFYAVFVFAMLGVVARGRWIAVALAAGLCLILVTLSSNKAAFLAIGGALVLLPIFWRDRSVRTAVSLSLIMPVAVGAAIVLVGSAWTATYSEEVLRASGSGPVPILLADSWASIWSRAMLVVVGTQSLIDAPWRVLTGIGWGHYNEALLANLSIVGGRLHEHLGPSRAYWDAIQRADFHSHNQYFEALLSSGPVAAVLVMAYGAATVACAAPERRRLALFVTLLLATLQSFWFQMPHTLPVMAIAMVVLIGDADDAAPSARPHWLLPRAGALAGGILAVAAVSAGMASRNIAAERAEIDWIVRSDSAQPLERRFAAGLREVYDSTLIQHAYGLTKDESSDAGPAALQTYLTAATAEGGPKSLRLSISSANVLSGIVFTRPNFQARFGRQETELRTSIERLMLRAPRRSDIAIPYFNHLLAAGRESETRDLANLILARRDDDPVALWFSGIVLLGQEVTAVSGMRNLKRSLISGIRNLMPVDDALVQSIEQ